MLTFSTRLTKNLFVALVSVSASASGSDAVTLVVCAPGYPGSTAEAQPAMNGLAAAVTDVAGWSDGALAAVYFETEAGCVDRMSEPDAAFTLLTLPMFLEHREAFGLEPVAQAVPAGRAPSEPWSLVAGMDRVHAPADLDGWEIVTLAGHSPRFVRGPALSGWGELPSTVMITFSGSVLSALRRAARGEDVALLLDANQTDALGRLPFADQLEIVHASPPLPTSMLCTLHDRSTPEQTSELVEALVSLDERSDAAEGLAGVRIDRFDPVDAERLEAAIASFDDR